MKTTNTPTPVLYSVIELSNKTWKLGFSTERTARPRIVSMPARDMERLSLEIQRAREKLGVDANGKVYLAYEAGRDGFWLYRLLSQAGIECLVVDPGSIEKPQRKHAKTDRLDVLLLMNRLMRWLDGDRRAWSVVRPPSEQTENERLSSREWKRLKKESTSLVTRIRSALCLHGIVPRGKIRSSLKTKLTDLRGPCGIQLPSGMIHTLSRELDRLALLEDQIAQLDLERKNRMKTPQTAIELTSEKLHRLKAVGPISAESLAQEFFSKTFQNRRQVGAAAGLTGTPFSSGDSVRESGISKGGNKRVRTTMVELAWCWLRYQPESDLSQWFQSRYGGGSSRNRKIGIVALARKLLIALWKYLERNELPAGAKLRSA